ncbi:MAG: stalk domain-containing protein [Ruminiclostridium sp.]
MQKFNKIGYLAIGIIIALIIGTVTPAFAASKDIVKQLTAYFTSGGKPISVYVNGTKVAKDSNGKAVTPFTVDGTTYLPVKAIADALGKDIKWDGTTASVKITDKASYTPNTAPTSDVIESVKPKITVTKDSKGAIHETMDYKFVLDKDAIGQWEAIDFVASLDEFDGKDTTKKDYIETSIRNFYDNGREAHYADKARGAAITQWTKGYVWGGDDVIEEYQIKQLNGKTFIFMQFKSGDYIFRGQKPNYMIYLKTSDTPDSEFAK